MFILQQNKTTLKIT